MVLSSVGPGVVDVSVLLSFLPIAVEGLSVGVVKNSLTLTFVVLEIAYVGLAVWPHVSPFPIFPALDEHAEEKPSIRPLKKPFTVHGVIQERTLINLASGSYATSPTIDLSFIELTFENRVIWEDFEAHPVRLSALEADLTPILRTAFPRVPVRSHDPLRPDIVFFFVVLKVVKGTERLVNVSHSLVLDLIDNKLVVLECEVVVDFLDVRVKPFSQINLDIILDLL